jgi:hypothetical protein
MLLVDYLQAVSKEDEKYSESVHELPAGIHSEVDQTHAPMKSPKIRYIVITEICLTFFNSDRDSLVGIVF